MPTRYTTLNQLIESNLQQFADRPAVHCAGHSLTYGQLDQLSLQFARYLQCHLGLVAGDRIAVQLPNVLQYPVVVYGALRAGLVLVNCNPLYTPRELTQQLCDSGAKVLVVLANMAHVAAEAVPNTFVQQVVVTEFADLHPWPKRSLINFALRYLLKQVPPYQFDRATPWPQALAAGAQGVLVPASPTADTLACLQYTGGTTGVAKGAMLSHGNLCSNAWQILSHCPYLKAQDNEVFIAPLPLYHIYAFSLHLLVGLNLGACNVLIPNPRDIPATVKALKPFRPTVFVGLNTLFKALCRFPAFKKLDFTALKTTPSGGMALTPDAAAAWLAITGCEINEGYGLTETSPVVCSNPKGAIQAGTIGTLVAETQAKVINDAEEPLPLGQAGELCVRGPQVMQGYWQRPQETQQAFTQDGWFKTGDIAVIQPDGYLKIVDRKKDMILVSGFNVYPNELEQVLANCPHCLEAAAIGVPDEKTGEAIKLFVVPSSASVTEQHILDYCRQQLTGYKMPKYIEFRNALPKSPVGKILRRELRT